MNIKTNFFFPLDPNAYDGDVEFLKIIVMMAAGLTVILLSIAIAMLVIHLKEKESALVKSLKVTKEKQNNSTDSSDTDPLKKSTTSLNSNHQESDHTSEQYSNYGLKGILNVPQQLNRSNQSMQSKHEIESRSARTALAVRQSLH